MPSLEDAPQYTSPSTRTFCVFKTISASVPTLSTYTSPSSFATVTRFSVESCATGCAGRRKAKNAVSRPGSSGRGGERETVRSIDDGGGTHPALCAHDDHDCGANARERADRSRRARRSTRGASTASTRIARGGNDAVRISPRDPRRRERSAPCAIARRRTHEGRTARASASRAIIRASRASATRVQARWQERRRMAPPSVKDWQRLRTVNPSLFIHDTHPHHGDGDSACFNT